MKHTDLDKAQNRYAAVQSFIDKGIITIDTSNDQITIHYLLWHSFKSSGINRMLYSFYFYAIEQLALLGKKANYLTLDIYVDYPEKNEYHEIGKVRVGMYNGKQLN